MPLLGHSVSNQPLLRRLQPYWRPIAASALLVGLGLFGAFLHGHSSLQIQRAQLDQYGQAMARSTAQRAVDATLSQDMISLQAVLQELTRHPKIVGATIHDVENQLLVQSGAAPNQAEPGQFLRYSATVAVDANVAGHLQIAVIPPRMGPADTEFFLYWGLIILVATSLPWLPQARGSLSFAKVQPPSKISTEDESTDTSEVEFDEYDVDPVEPNCRLRLRLQLANLPQLFRQLNRESFDQQLRQFEQQLRGVLSLYGGHRLALSEDTLLIDFKGESDSDCAFRALCGAQLLGELTHLNNGPRLRLNARIHALPDLDQQPASLIDDFALQHQPPREADHLGIEIDPALIDDELQKHLELDSETGALIGVKSPYRQLLDKQQQQLHALTTAED